MRLRGPHLIGQANLSTSTTTVSGTLIAGQGVIFTMSPYSFTQDGAITFPSAFPFWAPAHFFASNPVADPDAPVWALFNQGVTTIDYSIGWRHINP